MNVLFFGMGSIGRRHYRIFKEIAPNYQFYAYRREKNVCYNDDLMSVYSWEEVERIGFSAALICNPTAMHIEVAIECARRGINLFIEKPLSNSLEGVETLSRCERDNNLKVLIGVNMRFHPIIERLKELINTDEEKILRFSAYCGSYLPKWRDCDYRKTYSAIKEQGGGVILDLIHELDYSIWLIGQPARISGVFGTYSDMEIDVEDCAEMVLEYPGYLGVIHLDYFRPTPKRVIEVVTTKRVLEADLLAGTLSISNGADTVVEQVSVDRDLTYYKQMDHFNNVLLDKEPPRSTLDEAVGILKLAMEFKA